MTNDLPTPPLPDKTPMILLMFENSFGLLLTIRSPQPSSVRKGEFKWIYPSQEGANYVFNSFSSYELSVMKKYAMPLLEEIDTESEYFPVAERLIRMLKFFDDLSDKWVPCNSIIREFIGGSCYQDE